MSLLPFNDEQSTPQLEGLTQVKLAALNPMGINIKDINI